jgi:hypothetical protein
LVEGLERLVEFDFLQIPETYLQVGWPGAMRLAIQLESILDEAA